VISTVLRRPVARVLALMMAAAPVGAWAGPHQIQATSAAELGGTSPYANFLVGRYAMMSGDVDTASHALDAASQANPDNADLREQAFLINILNGDIDEASQLAKSIQGGSDTTVFMVPVVKAVTALKAGHGSEAVKALDAALKVRANVREAVLLRPYPLAMKHDWKAALDDSGDAALQAGNDRLLVYLVKAGRARLYELKGDAKGAEAVYKTLYQPGPASFLFGPDYAEFLERQGRKDEARKVWQDIAAQTNDPDATASIARLSDANAAPPPLPDLKASMAQALFMSATMSYSQSDNEMALATLRMSLYLDPSDHGQILLGQVETALKNPMAAEAAWAAVPDTSPYYQEAALHRITSLKTREQNDEAAALLDQVLAQNPDNMPFIIEKAGLLHDQNRDQDALDLINGRIARAGDSDLGWTAWFMQAVLYDSLDQWDKAEVAIGKARTLAGDRPEILNFLGYGWVNRGLHIEDGMDLIRKALSQTPNSGAIIDSLGWGYYKLGQYDEALGFIEQAVQLDPSDAEVNDHLGDVYKALGRNVEAGYEWSRVLTLKATSRELAAVRRKIDANAAVIAADTQNKAAGANATAFNDAGAAKKP